MSKIKSSTSNSTSQGTRILCTTNNGGVMAKFKIGDVSEDIVLHAKPKLNAQWQKNPTASELEGKLYLKVVSEDLEQHMWSIVSGIPIPECRPQRKPRVKIAVRDLLNHDV